MNLTASQLGTDPRYGDWHVDTRQSRIVDAADVRIEFISRVEEPDPEQPADNGSSASGDDE
jgi:hypothetical protein